MRIAYDATTLRPFQTGIGYYSEHLLFHLLEEAPDCEFHLISNRRIETSRPLPGNPARVEGGRFPIRNLWMQVLAPRLLGRLRPDLAHFTNSISPVVSKIPTVLTVHDLSLHLLPKYHPFRRRLFLPLHDACLRRADAVITVSEASRRDILRHSKVRAEKIRVIHEAAAPEFRPISDRAELEEVRRRYRLAERIILFVGTIEPRKNLVALIEAYRCLRTRHRIPHQLVLAGLPGWGYREVRRHLARLGLEGQVLITGYLPFQDLPPLYNLAEVFVFPSFQEGFGLPVLEAMSCGCPVVVSNHESLLEVAGEAALHFPPEEPESLVTALASLIDSPEKRRLHRRLSLERAAQFSWSRAALETIQVYREVIGGFSGSR